MIKSLSMGSAFFFILSAYYWWRAARIQLYATAILSGYPAELTMKEKIWMAVPFTKLPTKKGCVDVNVNFANAGYLNAYAATCAAFGAILAAITAYCV